MLKYRVWDKQEQKFIYPVIDITNDFYQNYPVERFVFDKFIFIKDEIEYYENDIIEIPFRTGSKGLPSTKELNFYAVLRNYGNNIVRFDEFTYQNYNKRDHLQGKFHKFRFYPHLNEIIDKIGNVHENEQLIIDEYKKHYFETKQINCPIHET